MYHRIIVPVDLGHTEELGKAITTAADIARLYKSDLTFVGISGSEPSKVARFPKEYMAKLEAFASSEAERTGVAISADAVSDHDVAVDLDAHLVKEAARLDADLIVMSSHQPTRFGTHAGHVAQRSPVSVLVVRG